MPLIIPGKPQMDFFLGTTKPFRNEKAVKDFFQIILSYGPNYRPVKYGRSDPVKELFDEKHLEKVTTAWLGGNDYTCEIFEKCKESIRNCLMMDAGYYQRPNSVRLPGIRHFVNPLGEVCKEMVQNHHKIHNAAVFLLFSVPFPS